MIWMLVHRTMRTSLMLRLPLLLAPLLLVACGTYALEKNSSSDFFLGLTLVGTPIAIERGKIKTGKLLRNACARSSVACYVL